MQSPFIWLLNALQKTPSDGRNLLSGDSLTHLQDTYHIWSPSFESFDHILLCRLLRPWIIFRELCKCN